MTRAAPGAGLGQAAEAIVVALARGGDDAAFAELVRRRQGWLRSLLRRLCRDAALADDLAQEVLLQAWRTLASLRSPGAFGAWLQQLCVRAWLQRLRHQRLEFAQPPPTAGVPHPAGLSQAADLTQETWAPQAAARPEDISTRLDLDAALAELAPLCRLCVVLAYHEGMSHGEISAVTALPLGTVKSHIRRGSEQLRGRLQAYRAVAAPAMSTITAMTGSRGSGHE